jgi:hypothetical protein
LSFAPNDDGEWSSKVALSRAQGRVCVRPGYADASSVQVGESRGEVIDRAEEQVLDGAGRRLDRGWGQRRLAAGRVDDAVDARGLGATQKCPDVLRILERIEDQDEWRFGPLYGTGENILERRVLSRFHDERHPLVAIEAGHRRERAALQLDDRDPQAGSVQNEFLEWLAALGHNEKSTGGPSSRKRLLDRPAAGNELLIRAEQIRWQERGRGPRPIIQLGSRLPRAISRRRQSSEKGARASAVG